MQTIIITGSCGQNAEMRQAGNSEVCSVSVAVNQGFGDKKTTNWYRVQIWGKRGSSLAPHLTKGSKVAVAGELEIGEYNGKPQYQINASTVDLMGGGQQRQERQPEPRQQSNGYADDLDDSVPF